MKKPSFTYRFICATVAMAMLFAVVLPAGLHASALAGMCSIDMTEHTDSHSAGEEHHSRAGTSHAEGVACEWDFNCSCSLDRENEKTSAIPTLTKVSADFEPVLIQTLDLNADPERARLSKQVSASDNSPPLFLKHSSFLN